MRKNACEPRDPADVYAHNRSVARQLVMQINKELDTEPTGNEDWADVGDMAQLVDYLMAVTEWME